MVQLGLGRVQKRCSRRWKLWGGPTLRNESKQMDSMAKVAWHIRKGGGGSKRRATVV